MNHSSSTSEYEQVWYRNVKPWVNTFMRHKLQELPESSCYCDEVDWRDRHKVDFKTSRNFSEEYYYLMAIGGVSNWRKDDIFAVAEMLNFHVNDSHFEVVETI